jgi:hypothetical protein
MRRHVESGEKKAVVAREFGISRKRCISTFAPARNNFDKQTNVALLYSPLVLLSGLSC